MAKTPTRMNKRATKVFSGLHRFLYRVSGGRIGSKLQGGRIVLLTTTGRKSGKARTAPLIAVDHEDGWAVIASYGGHDAHPAWYLNLRDDPSATLTVGTTEHSVVARDLEGEARDVAWETAVAAYRGYDEYQKVTERVIPVVALVPS